MKKRIVFISCLLLTIVFITSCATSVVTQYMVPAKYDMSSYRNLAILTPSAYRLRAYDLPSPIVRDMSGTSPVRVYSGFNVNSERIMNEYLNSKVVEKGEKSTYFTITLPSVADTYKERFSLMADRGIEAVLYISTEDIDIDEFIFAKEIKTIEPPVNPGDDPQEVTTLVYYLEQSVSVAFAWEVKSTGNGVILARDSYTDMKSETTKIDIDKSSSMFAPRIQGIMNEIASDFSSTIFEQLEPTIKTKHISLMKNNPKSDRVEEAYNIVKDGNLVIGLQIFEKEWKRNDHIPSVYNAALILEALDQRDNAIELLVKAYKESGNTKVRKLLDAMRERSSLTEQAESQL